MKAKTKATIEVPEPIKEVEIDEIVLDKIDHNRLYSIQSEISTTEMKPKIPLKNKSAPKQKRHESSESEDSSYRMPKKRSKHQPYPQHEISLIQMPSQQLYPQYPQYPPAAQTHAQETLTEQRLRE